MPGSIVEVMPAVLDHRVAPPAYARARPLVRSSRHLAAYLRRRGSTHAVLEAIGRVPRELFVPAEPRARAYDDRAPDRPPADDLAAFMVAAICAALDWRAKRACSTSDRFGQAAGRARSRGRHDRAGAGLAEAGRARRRATSGRGGSATARRSGAGPSSTRWRLRPVPEALTRRPGARRARREPARPAARDRDPGAARAGGEAVRPVPVRAARRRGRVRGAPGPIDLRC